MSVDTLPSSEECNCFAVRAAARHVTQSNDQLLAPTGLRTTQFTILAKLRRKGPLTINALAEAMVMDRTTLGRNILPLERDGLIRVEPAASDRRAKDLHLTKAGEKRFLAAQRDGPQHKRDLTPSLEPSAVRTYVHLGHQSKGRGRGHDKENLRWKPMDQPSGRAASRTAKARSRPRAARSRTVPMVSAAASRANPAPTPRNSSGRHTPDASPWLCRSFSARPSSPPSTWRPRPKSRSIRWPTATPSPPSVLP